MKGSIGYIVTVITTIIGLFSVLFAGGQEIISQEAVGPLSGFAVIFGGFLGGFIAPYHVGSNARKSVFTIIIAGGSLLALVYFTFQDAIAVNDDPLGGLGLTILAIFLIIGLIIAMVTGIIFISIGGFLGSLFGRLVFDRENYSDLEFDENLYHPV